MGLDEMHGAGPTIWTSNSSEAHFKHDCGNAVNVQHDGLSLRVGGCSWHVMADAGIVWVGNISMAFCRGWSGYAQDMHRMTT